MSWPPKKYDVVVSPVREVALVGTADYDYWQRYLLPEGLHPTLVDGRAQLTICAADTRFKGIRFRELSFSVSTARRAGGSERDGAFLVRAFNSIRFFAWVERTMFGTPYFPGKLAINVGPPAAVELTLKGTTVWRTAMASDRGAARTPSRTGIETWEGPIYLPRRAPKHPRKVFFGRLHGEAKIYPFSSAADTVRIEPPAEHDVFRRLIESDFRGLEWLLRDAGVHGKSKTVRRENEV